MIFKQHPNGSCDIVFSKEETEVIVKYQRLHLDANAFKHFGNHLMHMVVQWQSNFSDELNKVQTHKNTEVITDLKKSSKA